MTKTPTILEQFRSFYAQNSFNDLEHAVDYFMVFGGLNEPIDIEVDLFDLIEEHILDEYTHLNNKIANITNRDGFNNALLSGIATGDGRFHSVYKKARTTQNEAEEVLEELCDKGVIQIEDDLNFHSDKLYFTTPFMKFWFAFVSPFFKEIKEGDYVGVKQRFDNRYQEFTQEVFTLLCKEQIKLNYAHDPIIEMQSYWDSSIHIDIVAHTTSGKVISANCKYSNAKMKKTELTKLQEDCKKVDIEADIFVLCAKNGFTSELKSLKGKNLGLITLKNFKKLVENIDASEVMHDRIF